MLCASSVIVFDSFFIVSLSSFLLLKYLPNSCGDNFRNPVSASLEYFFLDSLNSFRSARKLDIWAEFCLLLRNYFVLRFAWIICRVIHGLCCFFFMWVGTNVSAHWLTIPLKHCHNSYTDSDDASSNSLNDRLKLSTTVVSFART